MQREVRCVVCPMGCRLTVTYAGAECSGDVVVRGVVGHRCDRGAAHGAAEVANPLRVLTTTVRSTIRGREVVPVRTTKPIPRKLLVEAMKVVNGLCLNEKVGIGHVMLSDVLGTGAGLIVTSDLLED